MGPQPHMDGTVVTSFHCKVLGWFVVWSQSSLCLAHLTWHTGVPCFSLMDVVSKKLPVSLPMYLALGCLWGISPFTACCCCVGGTPYRLAGSFILTLWGRKGIEEQNCLKAGVGCIVTWLCHRHLLVYSLLMISRLGVITFTGHCAVISPSW